MKVNLTGLSFEMKEQTRPIQILKKKIVMMLMKEIWKKNRLRENGQLVLKALS